ncbi:hypothetical protein DS745_03795 [Anaerobacillus alkaliphilus]|uniref:Uncharacterized protein n=1 Tax=Anaerobacillus alkaliphilus TaxID=1548597 RepID=A0A4Q0VZI1_9BACI|nr:hypothetical protein [Anaerobacillus alkaliphilus]RXJ04516.1 hypothetical protein DS745_03795 [Anaerobacillus alkaliphilus]
MKVTGSIISGEFDEQMNEFSLESVKHFLTRSTLRKNQLDTLYQYLTLHKNEEDGQVITLYDQLPLRLTQEETSMFIEDLDQIKKLYH